MPDLDSGHIFLTTFAPIKKGAPPEDPHTSYEQRVRMALAVLPTARQSPATSNAEFNSPFARNMRNHLARMFVLHDVVYNGRTTQNTLVSQIEGENPAVPQPVDRLKTPYLIFCADVDAVTQPGDPLPTNLTTQQQREVRASYARDLWGTMKEELVDLYSNCHGFEGVNSAEGFADYLDRCHVETTMPFHDYYLQLPKFHTLPLKALIYGVLTPLIIGLLALVLWLFGWSSLPFLGWSSLKLAVGAFILGGVLALLAIRFAIRNGEKPLAPGEYDDLPTVLKAIYIQQKMSAFFVDQQGASAEELHAAFGAFIKKHKPENRQSMTQKPGVISSADPKNVIS